MVDFLAKFYYNRSLKKPFTHKWINKMFKVTIKNAPIQGQWILLENADALMEYMEYTSELVVEQMKRLIKSKAHVERWDHMITNTPEGSLLAATILHCKMHGKNPILEMDGIMQQKFLHMLQAIIKGNRVLVNSVGGYCTMLPSWEIDTQEDMYIGFQPTHVINENTQYINLENDPELESHTRQFLGERDKNFSYVLNLHKYDKDALVKVFTEFKVKGGSIVYVYTTGMNVPQMYDYFEAAKTAGLNDFVFHFNAIISEGIKGFIHYGKGNSNFTVL